MTLIDRFERVSDAVETALLAQFKIINPKTQRIHFQMGHPLYVLRELTKLLKPLSAQYTRFPLIAVFEDIPQEYIGKGLSTVTPKVIIANPTKKEYSRAEREAYNFAPILRPLAEEWLVQARETGMFWWAHTDGATIIERPFWGREELYGNKANIFNDELDCIEISGLTYTVRETLSTKCGLRKPFITLSHVKA